MKFQSLFCWIMNEMILYNFRIISVVKFQSLFCWIMNEMQSSREDLSQWLAVSILVLLDYE